MSLTEIIRKAREKGRKVEHEMVSDSKFKNNNRFRFP